MGDDLGWGPVTPEPIELKFGTINYVKHATPLAKINSGRITCVGWSRGECHLTYNSIYVRWHSPLLTPAVAQCLCDSSSFCLFLSESLSRTFRIKLRPFLFPLQFRFVFRQLNGNVFNNFPLYNGSTYYGSDYIILCVIIRSFKLLLKILIFDSVYN